MINKNIRYQFTSKPAILKALTNRKVALNFQEIESLFKSLVVYNIIGVKLIV